MRKHGLIKHSESFLNDFFSAVIETKFIPENNLLLYVNQRIISGNKELAYKQIDLFKEKKIISEAKYKTLKTHIDNIQKENQFP